MKRGRWAHIHLMAAYAESCQQSDSEMSVLIDEPPKKKRKSDAGGKAASTKKRRVRVAQDFLRNERRLIFG